MNEQERQELQFISLFRNQFGVAPDDLGLTVRGYTAVGNGHELQLHVENGQIIDWKLDGGSYCPHEVIQKNTAQGNNLGKLRNDIEILAPSQGTPTEQLA